MNKPKAYPNTDTAENEAVILFKCKINCKYVKAGDIKTRDKYPNIDGTVELVDGEGIPLGKFDVQVKKIPDESHKYSCPSSLVAYSQVSTLPIVFIGVDVTNEIVYWKSISSYMPEYKVKQASFTIKFDKNIDVIDKTGLYIKHWREIIEDYQERISNYPRLKYKLDFEKDLLDVHQEDIILFQKFIGTINKLLDSDFKIVKELFFRDVWQLGVRICNSTEEDAVVYSIYKITY